MSTTSVIEINAQLSAYFAGAAPINTGRIAFSPGAVLKSTVSNQDVFAKRITFGDLTLSGGIYYYQLLADAFSTIELSTVGSATDLAGETIDFFDVVGTVYIHTNAYCTLFTPLPLPEAIDTNGVILVKTAMTMDALAPNDEIISLGWSAASIGTTGSSNFFCDLIFASA